jgi:pyruvate dehydrogenase E2 component (dihydrolipoamide acetyltransferase)
MAAPVIMPKFEMSQETATIIEWLKHEGDEIEKGEPLLMVETDKVAMEIESPAAGVLAGVRAHPEQVVPVTEIIAYVLEPGEQLPEETEPAASEAAPSTPSARTVAATPVAQRMAETHEVDLQEVTGSGRGGRISRADIDTYLKTREDMPPSRPGKVRAVPGARRLAREMDIDLETVVGSGPRGRIQSGDVQRAAAEVATISTVIPERPTVRRTVPLAGMRRTIAERMLSSVRQAPQFAVEVDVDVSRAMAVVEDWRDGLSRSSGPRVTLTTVLVKACSWALVRHPMINAALLEDHIVEWEEVNVGVAVAVEDGLIVPVIHNADQLTINEIATRLTDIAARAQQGELRPEDVRMGTFTLSNLGMFGIDRFTAILNPPQAAILAVGRVSKRLLIEDDQTATRPLATFNLTADHRVVDGVLASRFLTDLRLAIEHPGIML